MRYISLILMLGFVILSAGLSAQDATPTMKFEGKEVAVSRDLDARYMGVYVKNEGKRKWQYGLRVEGAESFYLEQQADDKALRFEWDLDNKQVINWGLMLRDGEPVTITISEVEAGQMKSYQAQIVLIENTVTGKVEALHLYESEGQIFLGYAKKVNEVASALPDRR